MKAQPEQPDLPSRDFGAQIRPVWTEKNFLLCEAPHKNFDLRSPYWRPRNADSHPLARHTNHRDGVREQSGCDSSWRRSSAKEFSQCHRWSFESAADPGNRDGSLRSEMRAIANIRSMALTSIRSKRFSTRLMRRGMLCKPAARPKSGLKIGRLQRGCSRPLGEATTSRGWAVHPHDRAGHGGLCEVSCPTRSGWPASLRGSS
jgi:hypothetical protein